MNTAPYGNSPQHIIEGILIDNFNDAFESGSDMNVAGQKAALILNGLKDEDGSFNIRTEQFEVLTQIASRAVVGRAIMKDKSEAETLEQFAKFVEAIGQHWK